MPSILEIKQRNTKFKKKSYRAWNPDGIQQIEPRQEHVLSVPTTLITNWKFSDRPASELGDIEALSKEFLEIGQQQPCIARPLPYQKESGTSQKYELIVGERRWRAAQKAGLDLKIITKDLSDIEAAIIQASENSSRQDLSDYAKGMSFHQLLKNDVISATELATKLQISRQYLSKLLSFAQIPEKLIAAIQDLRNISCHTAEKMKQLCNRGKEYEEALISLAPAIREKNMGFKTINTKVEEIVNNLAHNNSSSDAMYSKGRRIFSWRSDRDHRYSIHFARRISDTLNKNPEAKQEIMKKLQQSVEDMMKNTQ